jgi:hypothetical protein
MFEAAGFRRVIETASHADRLPRWLMRLDLERPGEARRVPPHDELEVAD